MLLLFTYKIFNRLGVEFYTSIYERFNVNLSDPILSNLSDDDLEQQHIEIERIITDMIMKHCFPTTFRTFCIYCADNELVKGENEYVTFDTLSHSNFDGSEVESFMDDRFQWYRVIRDVFTSLAMSLVSRDDKEEEPHGRNSFCYSLLKSFFTSYKYKEGSVLPVDVMETDDVQQDQIKSKTKIKNPQSINFDQQKSKPKYGEECKRSFGKYSVEMRLYFHNNILQILTSLVFIMMPLAFSFGDPVYIIFTYYVLSFLLLVLVVDSRYFNFLCAFLMVSCWVLLACMPISFLCVKNNFGGFATTFLIMTRVGQSFRQKCIFSLIDALILRTIFFVRNNHICPINSYEWIIGFKYGVDLGYVCWALEFYAFVSYIIEHKLVPFALNVDPFSAIPVTLELALLMDSGTIPLTIPLI